MATILKFRRFTTDTSNFAGSVGELTVDTDKKTVRVHDGATIGGSVLATESFVNTRIDYVKTSYSTTQEVENMDATIHTLANQYTDTRETAIRSTLTTSLQDYDTSLEVDGKITTALTILNDYDTSLEVDGKISTAISDVIGGAPGALNTLNELATSLNNDASYATTITNALALKANASDVTTSLALKANITYVDNQLATRDTTISGLNTSKAPLASPALTGTPTAPTAARDTNTTQVATTAFTMTQIAHAISVELPAGFIGMWSGDIASIPVGWYLCDGTNGTPNLTDRFIVGAGNGTTYAPGDTGGSNSATLTTNELPAHTHTGTTASNGDHNHLVANTDTALTTQNLNANNTLSDIGNLGTSYSYNLGGTDSAATIGNTTTNGAHTHTFTSDSTGAGNAFDIRPKYYALAYIMKHY